MSFIRRILSRCFLFVERRLKGNKVVKNISLPEDQDFMGELTGYSVTGYEIKIYCSKVRYRKKYSRWYVPPSNIELYHVYSAVSPDAPENLKAACALEITIPPPHPDFLNDEFQKDAAIEWYLDLLIQRMPAEDRFNS